MGSAGGRGLLDGSHPQAAAPNRRVRFAKVEELR
jgi:hypothetical protein